MRSWISRWFWWSRVDWASTISSPPASPQPLPCMNQEKKFHLISASIHDRNFFWFEAQPCMNQAKKLSIGLSLNTWQEKKFNWTSALNELVHFLDSESQSQPWKKIIHDPVSISICYRGGKIWKISVSLRNFFFVINTFKAEGRQKIGKKGPKMGHFWGKSAIFSLNSWPQYMISR